MKISSFFLLVVILFGCKPGPGNFIKTSDGIDMCYEIHGTKEPTLIFVPGWTCDATAWDDQIIYFKDKYRVVVLDLPGFGRSGSDRNNWSMERYGADVAELATELKLENVLLIGHSLGGCVVLEAAKKFQSELKAVVLVDVLRSLNATYDSTHAINYFNAWKENIKNFDYLYSYFGNDSTLAKRWLAMLPSSIPESWFPILEENFRWRNEDAIPSVSVIDIPIRAINSDRSETNFEEWNTYARDFNAIIIENCGHYVHWEYPDEFNEALNGMIKEITE